MILHLKNSSGCPVENRLWEEGQREALAAVSPVIPAGNGVLTLQCWGWVLRRGWTLNIVWNGSQEHAQMGKTRAAPHRASAGRPSYLPGSVKDTQENPSALVSPFLHVIFRCLALCHKKIMLAWASLVAQWLRICLPMQGTRVRALVWEDPTCRGATGPVSHNYWACACGACAPQQERPRQWEARAPRWRVVPTCRN